MAIIPTDLLDRIRALERQVRDLMGSANTTPALNRIMGGEVVIGDKGRLRVRTSGDEDLLYLGRVQPDRGTDDPQQGFVVRRDDGSLALTIWTAAPDTLPVQPVQVFDRRGNVVVADDAVHGGLARPYIPHPLPGPVGAARRAGSPPGRPPGRRSTRVRASSSTPGCTARSPPRAVRAPRGGCSSTVSSSPGRAPRATAWCSPSGCPPPSAPRSPSRSRPGSRPPATPCAAVPLALYGVQS